MKRKHVHSARRIQYRSLPYEDVCFFCHVLDDDSFMIGGQYPAQDTWELATYNLRVYFYYRCIRKNEIWVDNRIPRLIFFAIGEK